MDRGFDDSTRICGLRLFGAKSALAEREPGCLIRWSRQAQKLQIEAHAFYFAFRHPRVRWDAKLVAVCTAIYLFSPIQLIPSFIPVIGFLDDFLILFLGVKLLERIIPPDVFIECHELAEAAGKRRKEEIRSTAAVAGLLAILSLWLIAAFTASALMAKYVSH